MSNVTIPAFRAAELVKLAESWQRTPSNKKAADLCVKVKELLRVPEGKDIKQTNFFDATEIE